MSLSRSRLLSGSDIEKHDCRGLQWYLGLLFSSSLRWYLAICGLCGPDNITSAPFFWVCLWPSCAGLSWDLSVCVCTELWGSSWVLLAQNRTSGLIIHAANTLIWPGSERTLYYSGKALFLWERLSLGWWVCCSSKASVSLLWWAMLWCELIKVWHDEVCH